MKKYQLEIMREIWPDHGDGEYLEIGPDRDGTELVEIRQKEPDGKISARLTVHPDAARLLANALTACADELSSANANCPPISELWKATHFTTMTTAGTGSPELEVKEKMRFARHQLRKMFDQMLSKIGQREFIEAIYDLTSLLNAASTYEEFKCSSETYVKARKWPKDSKVPALFDAMQEEFGRIEETWETPTQHLDPKKARGEKKRQLQLLPPAFLHQTAAVLEHGAAKYGQYNWREHGGVENCTYYGAMMRHLVAIMDGEDIDPDSELPHAAHIAASCAILIDAKAKNKLTDTRVRAQLSNENDQIQPANQKENKS